MPTRLAELLEKQAPDLESWIQLKLKLEATVGAIGALAVNIASGLTTSVEVGSESRDELMAVGGAVAGGKAIVTAASTLGEPIPSASRGVDDPVEARSAGRTQPVRAST